MYGLQIAGRQGAGGEPSCNPDGAASLSVGRGALDLKVVGPCAGACVLSAGFLEEDTVQPSLLELVAEEFLSPMEGQCIERRELETKASCTSAGAYWCRLREAGRRHWVRRLIRFIEQGLVSREGWHGVEFVPQPGEARMPEQLEKAFRQFGSVLLSGCFSNLVRKFIARPPCVAWYPVQADRDSPS